MMVTQRVPRFLGPVCGLVGRKLSFKQTDAGTVLIGGGHLGFIDEAARVARPDPRKLSLSAQTVVDVFPLMRGVPVARCWCGIEGVMPDQLPVIGPSQSADGVFHAFGFSAHGFALGPIVGRLMAELVIDGHASLPLEPFAIGRFGDARDAARAPGAWPPVDRHDQRFPGTRRVVLPLGGYAVRRTATKWRVTVDIERFMQGYKKAWEQRDDQLFCALFAPDGTYRNTPFAVQRGHAELAAYWQRVKLQEDVAVSYEVLASSPGSGIAHWHVTY